RTETFGTRHDVAGTPVDRFIRLTELDGTLDSVQMIHDMQVIKPGATLYSGLHLAVPTFWHLAAFAAAWNEAAPRVEGRDVINLGGELSVGYGACAVGVEKHPNYYQYDADELVAAYETHLRDHRAEILALLEEITGRWTSSPRLPATPRPPPGGSQSGWSPTSPPR